MKSGNKFVRFLIIYLAGMILGPLLDRMHVHSGVLAYNEPEQFQAWWVPFLFGAATLGISILLISVEKFLNQKSFTTTWKATLVALAVFIFLYGFSAYSHSPSWVIFLVIAIIARRLGVYFIKNKSSLVIALLVTFIGPIVEISLTSASLFHYTHPDIWGIPLWLYPLYFCAAIAVSLLIRSIFDFKPRPSSSLH